MWNLMVTPFPAPTVGTGGHLSANTLFITLEPKELIYSIQQVGLAPLRHHRDKRACALPMRPGTSSRGDVLNSPC